MLIKVVSDEEIKVMMNTIATNLRKIEVVESDKQTIILQAADLIDKLCSEVMLLTVQRDNYLKMYVDGPTEQPDKVVYNPEES